jgi:hypothetical protein
MAGTDGRIEHKKIGSDTAGSHVYRAWGDMYRQSMAYREPDSEGKIHRVDPHFGSTLTASSMDSQSNCWVNWKIMGQPCEFQVRIPRRRASSSWPARASSRSWRTR